MLDRAVCVLCLVSAACQVAQPARVVVAPHGFATAADFPGASRLLAGFDAAGDDTWRAGDEVLFGLQLRSGTDVQRWLLHLRLIEPKAIARAGEGAPEHSPLPPLQFTFHVAGAPRQYASVPSRAIATVCDADGNVLGRSEPVLPRDFLARGFAEACGAVMSWLPRSHDAESVDRFLRDKETLFAEATITAVALLRVVQDDRVLSPLLWQVMEKPSLWSVVSSLGVSVTLQPNFHVAAHVEQPACGGVSPWRVPMAVLVNDQRALDTELSVVPAVRPFALCGGIVGITARNPHDPTREASLVLLAARTARTGR